MVTADVVPEDPCGAGDGKNKDDGSAGVARAEVVDESKFEEERKAFPTHLRIALRWLDTKPLDRTLIARQIMELNLNVLKGKNYYGSNRYEIDQLKAELRAVNAGVGESQRSYPVVDCAMNKRSGLSLCLVTRFGIT